MFVTITKLTGEPVIGNRDSLAAIVDWAVFHNMQFVELESDLRSGAPVFTAQRADGDPVGEAALVALRDRCRWLRSEEAPHEYLGCGLAHSAAARRLRESKERNR